MRGALPGTLAVLALLLAAAAAPAQQPDLDALLSRAVTLHQGGDLEGAVSAYAEVLRLAPGASLVRSNLGAAYAGLGRYEEAIVEYRRALEAADEPSIRQNLALALQKAGRLQEAADEVSRLVAADPANRAALLLLADTRLRLGQDAEVVGLLEPLAAASPDDKAIAFLLGSALLNLDRSSDAAAVMNRVFADGSPEAHVLLGSLHSRRQEYDEALRELEKARAVNPKLPLVNFLYGRCLMEKSDWAGAEASFRRELEVDPNHFESNLMLGNLLRKNGEHDAAVKLLTHAARLRPQDLSVKYALGAACLALGRTEDARPLLEAVAAAMPDHQMTHMQLAVLYTRLGRSEDAARERATAVRLQKEADARGLDGARERLSDVLGRASQDKPPQQ